ncbi:hypothetical protein LCGC14_0914400 [marine sediment metagenome]|uniref:Terminase large subunit gp17-like C-terminal domain-containing protein n=2 Tax=marine sediment metagenome TaxID=412755 RepID=A0A0F9PDE5_9ZZZZ
MTPEALIIESMFRVVTKEGVDVDFVLNSAQRQIDENMTGRDIIPKARQEGVSTYFLARYTAACLRKRNVKATIISHEQDATSRLLSRCTYFLDNLRGPDPVRGRSGVNIITFPKTDSMIYIGTAGSKKFGRGDTITHLHCSEYAYWPNAKSLLSGLFQAVPRSGEIAIESTGNGKGNDYHRRSMRAYNGQSMWKCHFLDWLNFEEYTLPIDDESAARVMASLNEEWEEPELVKNFGLTAGQILWRRMKLDELDFDLREFKTEYPATIDECFQASGDSLFYKVLYAPSAAWKKEAVGLYILEPHPIQHMRYVIGVDPSGGIGKDAGAINIICLDTMEQVGEYAHNKVYPDVLGGKVVDLAERFNHAYVVVEANNHGPITLRAIKDREYPGMLVYSMGNAGADFEDKHLMQQGFRTTARTKPILIGHLRTLLAHSLTIHSPALSDELSTFIEHEDGKLAAQNGCYDDLVISLACAGIGLRRAGLYLDDHTKQDRKKKAKADPFSLDGIIDEMQGKSKVGIHRPQHLITNL